MGLVINPTAFRIGHVKAWTDAWYLHRMHYPVFVHKSLEIKTLLQYILLRKYPSQWSHWIYSHTTYYFCNSKFYVNLFVYDGNDPHNYYISAKDHKYGWFRKSKFKRFWTKRQLLDLQFLYQRWFLLCQVMNLDFEDLQLDSLKWRVKKRGLRKIEGLRRKYGSSWVAREELFVWKFLIGVTSEDCYNKMGINILNLLYKWYIMPKIRSAFKSPDFDLVDTANSVLKSHKILYFFFSYIDRILKAIPTYPVGLFNRLTYKATYRFFRMYFIFKPYWIHLSKLYELILLYINVDSKVHIYLLDNIHLNASYIARYIMTCLRLKFDYRDTMIPIRKTLLKIMYSKRWRPIRDFKKKNWQIYLERYKHLLKDRIKFYLINNDILKMFLYRFSFIKKLKKLLKKLIYRRFSIFNFMSLKLNIISLKSIENIILSKPVLINYFLLKKINFLNFFHFNYKKRMKTNLKKEISKHFFKKYKKTSFNYFNVRRLKKNKKFNLSYFRNFRIRRNFWIHIRKKFLCVLYTFFLRLKKYKYFKNLIYSFIFLNNIKLDYSFDFILKQSFIEKYRKFNIKATVWLKKKKRIRRRLSRIYKSMIKNKYRIKLETRFDLLPYRMNWIHSKRWSRSRRKFFQVIKKKFWCYKVISLNLLNLPIKLLNIKTIIIFFYNYITYLYDYKNFCLYKKFLLNLFSNKFFFYDKKFKKNYINFFLNLNVIRGYSNLFFFNFLNKYSIRYKPFFFNIDLYRTYIKNVSNLPDVDDQFIPKKPKKYDLEEMPLKDKFKRLRILEGGSRSLLYGYKFHFVGRFTRKQKAASLWFAKGANSVSSMRVDIDYGFHTIPLRYSACTLKVWLYRNRGYSFKYGYRLV